MLIRYNIYLLFHQNNLNNVFIIPKLCIDSKEPLIHLLYSIHIEVYYDKNYEKTLSYNIGQKCLEMLFVDKNGKISTLKIRHNKKYKSFIKLLKSYISNSDIYDNKI